MTTAITGESNLHLKHMRHIAARFNMICCQQIAIVSFFEVRTWKLVSVIVTDNHQKRILLLSSSAINKLLCLLVSCPLYRTWIRVLKFRVPSNNHNCPLHVSLILCNLPCILSNLRVFWEEHV